MHNDQATASPWRPLPSLAARLLAVPLTVSLSLATLCGSPAALADEEGTLNIYLNGGYHWFNSDRLEGTPLEGYDLEDSAGGGLGFDFSLTDRWGLGGAVDLFTADLEDSREDVDVLNYHLDLLYHFGGRFCGNFCWQPYVAGGVGEIRVDYDDRFDRDFDWHDRQTMVNLGLGVKYHLGPRWQARADARIFQGVENGGLDGFVSIGIGYQWIEDFDTVWDIDGDGIPDSADGCPQTPPGVNVSADGCPVDADLDGIPDYLDRCPSTPVATAVDETGCPQDG